MENSYLPIDTQTIRGGTGRSFDLFFQTREGKFVLYCAGGEAVGDDIRKKITEYNIDKFYIKKIDKINYDLYIQENLINILKDPDISDSDKAKSAYNTVITAAQSLFESPGKEIIQGYKKVIFNTLKFVFKDESNLQKLIGLTNLDFSNYNHSINVGIYSLGLSKKLISNEFSHDLKQMAAGFFLHDIGKSEIPSVILNKKGPLSHVQWEIMKKHPEKGYKILEKSGEMSEEIEIIVMQHHERHDGNGYPRGLKDDQIHMYAKICSIADVFDALTSYRKFKNNHSTFNALKIIKEEMNKNF
ncbi:HD-GYP domain-containing protein, partial [Candidatus Latescibacterota bacterium]